MSKKRNYDLFLLDIIDSIEKIEKYTKGFSQKKFIENELINMAVIKFYEIIGEAAKNIPAEIRKLAPDIPWKNIIGFRNIVIHKYFSIDLENVWFITKKQLPALKTQIKALLKAIKNK